MRELSSRCVYLSIEAAGRLVRFWRKTSFEIKCDLGALCCFLRGESKLV